METGKTMKAYNKVFIFAKFIGGSVGIPCGHCSLNNESSLHTPYRQICLRDRNFKCGPSQIILTKEDFKKLKHQHLITLK